MNDSDWHEAYRALRDAHFSEQADLFKSDLMELGVPEDDADLAVEQVRTDRLYWTGATGLISQIKDRGVEAGVEFIHDLADPNRVIDGDDPPASRQQYATVLDEDDDIVNVLEGNPQLLWDSVRNVDMHTRWKLIVANFNYAGIEPDDVEYLFEAYKADRLSWDECLGVILGGPDYAAEVAAQLKRPDASVSYGASERSSDDREYREWEDTTGEFTTEAAFDGYGNGIVTLLKKEGSRVQVPVEQLSDKDKDFLRKRAKEAGMQPPF